MRLIKFFVEQSKKDLGKYTKFFEDYGMFMREGIVTITEQDVKVCRGGGNIDDTWGLFSSLVPEMAVWGGTSGH